jgi:hypothetical protein
MFFLAMLIVVFIFILKFIIKLKFSHATRQVSGGYPLSIMGILNGAFSTMLL